MVLVMVPVVIVVSFQSAEFERDEVCARAR